MNKSNINDFVIGESPWIKNMKRYKRWRFFIKIKQKIQLWWLELTDKN